MKRFLFFAILMSLLIGCSNQESKSDIVIQQNLDENIQADILHLLADQLALWDISINNKVAEEIEIVIDHYHFDKKQEPLVQMSTVLDGSQKSQDLKLMLAEQAISDVASLTSAFISEDSLSSAESFIPITDDFSTTTYGLAPTPLNVDIGEEIILGTIILTNTDGPISTGTTFDKDFDEQELKDYDHTYIMKLIVY